MGIEKIKNRTSMLIFDRNNTDNNYVWTFRNKVMKALGELVEDKIDTIVVDIKERTWYK